MNAPQRRNYSLADVGILIGALATAAGSGWGVAWASFERSENMKVVAYETAQELQLPNSLEELRELSKALRPALEERKAALALPELTKKIVELQSQVDQVTRERNNLRTSVAAIEQVPRTISIRPGESKYAIPNALVVGVERLSTISSSCDFQYANKAETLKVAGIGSGRDPESGFNYKFKVTRVDEQTGCTIDFVTIGGPSFSES